jgi:hypothetical protein
MCSHLEMAPIRQLASSVFDDGFGFDLHAPSRVEQTSHHDHRAGWSHLSERRTVRSTHGFSVIGARDEHARANNMAWVRARFRQRAKDYLEAPSRLNLRVGIT